ncbi:MAG: hypothetical protein K6G47_07760 [Clostridia bacterium]|nr:hypothetical protein [Clostridiales bacterium]MCR5804145.1 hypothetical protein [Clostridia bacterium]
MARDIKWAIKEAEEGGAIRKVEVEDETKKKLFSKANKTNVMMFFGSIILLVVAIGIVALLVTFLHFIIYSIKMVIVYILLLIFPIYAIYRIFSMRKAMKKGDYDFYMGEIVTKTDKGYKIKGLEDQDLNFSIKPENEVKQGDTVKLIRIADEVDLF